MFFYIRSVNKNFSHYVLAARAKLHRTVSCTCTCHIAAMRDTGTVLSAKEVQEDNHGSINISVV